MPAQTARAELAPSQMAFSLGTRPHTLGFAAHVATTDGLRVRLQTQCRHVEL
jgi:hypothetical protein